MYSKKASEKVGNICTFFKSALLDYWLLRVHCKSTFFKYVHAKTLKILYY